jgi:hypothetical protein
VDFGILESSKIFVVAPFCHPKRMDLGWQVGLLWEMGRLKPRWELFSIISTFILRK